MARANFQWAAASPASWINLASGTDAVVSLLSEDAVAHTFRRMIVDVFINTQSGVDGGQWHGRCGMILVDAVTAGIGVTALPKPETNGDQEWLWNRGFARDHEGTGVTAISLPPLHLHDDVRGMRKGKQTDTLVFVIQNKTGLGIRFMPMVRVLIST